MTCFVRANNNRFCLPLLLLRKRFYTTSYFCGSVRIICDSSNHNNSRVGGSSTRRIGVHQNLSTNDQSNCTWITELHKCPDRFIWNSILKKVRYYIGFIFAGLASYYYYKPPRPKRNNELLLPLFLKIQQYFAHLRCNRTATFYWTSHGSFAVAGLCNHYFGKGLISSFSKDTQLVLLRRYSNDANNNNNNNSHNESSKSHKRPPMFGSSLQLLIQKQEKQGVDKQGSKQEQREDCPICIKYSQGPCGDLFKHWLECTDKYTDQIDPDTGEELHLSKCLYLAKPLADCLEQNQEFYSKPPEDYPDEVLKLAWQTFLQDMENEEQKTTTIFPKQGNYLIPQIQIYGQRGVVSFREAKNQQQQQLVVGYVKDQDNVVIAAAMREDMLQQAEELSLLIDIPATLKYVTVFAVYDDDPNVIYTKVVHVPTCM